jgi:hypothetical protein
MTPVEVKQLLGKPSKTGKDALEYQSEVQVFDRTDGAEKPPVRWTRFRSVLVEFKDGIAVAIRVGQGTTS